MTAVVYTGVTGRETVGYSIDGEDLIERQPARPRATRPARPRPRRRRRRRAAR